MKLLFISLGCDKNLVDSEFMLGMLTQRDITLTDFEEEADIIIINTCAFIGDAKEESINTLLDMAAYKEDKCKLLVAAGCLAQRYQIVRRVAAGLSAFEVMDVKDRILALAVAVLAFMPIPCEYILTHIPKSELLSPLIPFS